jgi:hypothetical protein
MREKIGRRNRLPHLWNTAVEVVAQGVLYTSGVAAAAVNIRLSKIGRLFKERKCRKLRGGLRFTKRTGWADGRAEQGVDVGHAGEFFAVVVGAEFCVQAFSDFAVVGEADVGEVCIGREGFVAVLAIGLEAAKFSGAFVEETMGLVAGFIHRQLGFREVFGAGGSQRFFDEAAAAETPGGPADFVEESFFENACGGEVVAEGFVEFGVELLFAGTDEVVESV